MALPVDPERLRLEFPDLSDEDLAAFVAVTTRILAASTKDRPRVTREALEGGRRAQQKAQAGGALSAEESLNAHYVAAVEKMQGGTSGPSTPGKRPS